MLFTCLYPHTHLTLSVLPLSFYQPAHGVCFSMPAILGKGGVRPGVALTLNKAEEEKLRVSAAELVRVVGEYEGK